MEKTEVVAERSGFGKMLPPKLPLDKIKLQIPKKWAFVKESILLSIGFLWGNTTVFRSEERRVGKECYRSSSSRNIV